jgi:hypothetical protein
VKGSDLLVVVNCGLNGGVLKLPAASGGGRLLALNRRKSRQHWVFARADRVSNLRDKTAMDPMVDFNDDISHCPCNKHQFSVVSCLLI